MYDTPKREELSPNESYAWGIIRALTDLAFAHAKASKKNAMPPTRWLYMAHPKVANVGREYNLLMHHLSQYAPYDDDGASYIAMITDVMQIAGFGLDFGEMTEAPGEDVYKRQDLTIAGWKEDLNMSFMTVPAQMEAVE